MSEGPWLSTPRQTLRQPVAADLDRVFAIHSHPLSYRHLPSGRMTRVEQASVRLDEWLSHWAEHGFGYAGVEVPGGGTVVGFAGAAHHTLAGRPVLNLYYRFDPESWGHGYAGGAVGAVVEWARVHQPELPLVARVATNNPSSIRVAERAGLVRQSVTDPTDPVDHLLFASLTLPPPDLKPS